MRTNEKATTKNIFCFRQSPGVVVFALNMADSSHTFWIGEKVCSTMNQFPYFYEYFLSCSGESFGVPAVTI